MANYNENLCIFGGRLTANPDYKVTNSGMPLTTFTIAITGRKPKNATEAPTTFVQCMAFDSMATLISQFFKKGSSIAVHAEAQNNNYTDQQGVKHYGMRYIIRDVKFVDSKSDDNAAPAADYVPDNYTAKPEAGIITNTNAAAPKFEDIKDDEDLPF